MGELLMKKIIILFLCLITVNITGCSNFQEKKDDNNQNQTSQTEKITKPDFLDKDPYFFNTAFNACVSFNRFCIQYRYIKNES